MSEKFRFHMGSIGWSVAVNGNRASITVGDKHSTYSTLAGARGSVVAKRNPDVRRALGRAAADKREFDRGMF